MIFVERRANTKKDSFSGTAEETGRVDCGNHQMARGCSWAQISVVKIRDRAYP